MSEFTCPEHGGELIYDEDRNSDLEDWEDHWSCPVGECNFERHTS